MAKRLIQSLGCPNCGATYDPKPGFRSDNRLLPRLASTGSPFRCHSRTIHRASVVQIAFSEMAPVMGNEHDLERETVKGQDGAEQLHA